MLALPALAQYRPPPPTEAERLTAEGDESRVAAGKALLRGDKSRAKETFTEALETYEKALKANPDHLPAATGLGEVATALGDHERLVRLLAPFNRAHPESIEVAYYLGLAHFKLKQVTEAVPLLEQVSEAKKAEHLLAHYYLGRYYLAEQRPELCVRALNRYLAARPEKLAGNDHQIFELLGHAYLLANQLPDARAAFTAAQNGRPEALSLQLGLTTILEREGKYKEAIAALNGLSTRFPRESAPRERLGWLLLSTGEIARAREVAEAALKLDPSATIHQLAGEVALARNDASAAEQLLRKSLSLAPNLHEARFALARAVQKLGRNDEAISILEDAHRRGLDTVDLWAALGSVYRRAGRFQDAVQAHERVVSRSPTLARGHLLLGADYYVTGEWDQAITHYGLALKQDPMNAVAKHWLALSLAHRARLQAKNNDFVDAERDLRRALDLEKSAVIARSLGAVLLAREAYADAAEVLTTSTRLPGAQWSDHFLLGYAYLGLKGAEKSVAAFEAASRLTREPALVSDIYAGWALAKLELGDFDTAVAKLQEPGQSKAALKVVESNLPPALVRRAFSRIQAGDVEGAKTDVDAAEKLTSWKSEMGRLVRFARALVEVEQGDFNQAKASILRAVAKPQAGWVYPNTRQLAESYVDYRKGSIPSSRKWLKGGSRKVDPQQSSFVTELERALNRREGELAYDRGAMGPAFKALSAAMKVDPLNPYLIHNMACVNYRRRKTSEAITAWKNVAAAVPESYFNLGIDAQVREKDMDRAVDYFARHVAVSGSRAGVARRWKDRLQMIYGIREPAVGDGAASNEASDALAPATTSAEGAE